MITGRNAEGGFKGRTSHGWSRWREMSQKAADVQARVLLTIFYFTVMLPFGVVMGLFKDPLRIKSGRAAATGWSASRSPRPWQTPSASSDAVRTGSTRMPRSTIYQRRGVPTQRCRRRSRGARVVADTGLCSVPTSARSNDG